MLIYIFVCCFKQPCFEHFSGCSGAVPWHGEGQQCPAVSGGVGRDRARATENRNSPLWHQGLPGRVSHCLFPKACSEFSLGLCAFPSKFWCGRDLWHVLTSGFKSWPLRAIELDTFCPSNLCSKTVLWSSSGQSNLSNTCIWKPLGLLIIFLE